jgi:hypothetical protein
MSARRGRGLTHDGIVRIGEEQYPCKVTDMSATGAVLTFTGPVALPTRFILALTPLSQVVRGCTMTWEEGEQVGVVFGDAAPG